MRAFLGFLVLANIFSLVVTGKTIKHTQASIVGLKWLRFGSDKSTTESVLKEASQSYRVTNFVTHGENTEIENFPYQVTILIDYEGQMFHLCGGVIIGRKKILTAAHCTVYMDTYDHYVGVGMYDLSLGLNNEGSQLYRVRKYQNHHRYIEDITEGVPNDISILSLVGAMHYNNVVQRANLARRRHDRPGQGCYVSGYGLDESFQLANVLQSGYQVAISRNLCRNLWQIYPMAHINKRHICSMFYPVSACNGDSGGPLTCGGRVVGLTSWGSGGCEGCTPVVFTRISALLPWIYRNK